MSTTTFEEMINDQAATPPAPAAAGGDVRGACSALTRAAIQDVITAIAGAAQEAAENNKDNGEDAPGAQYSSAAPLAVGHLGEANQRMTHLQAWCDGEGVYSPDGYISNTMAAYNVYSYVRETVWQLHHARHWSAVSAVCNSGRGADHARRCVDLISDLLVVLESLGTTATRCYLSRYFD